MNEQPGVDPLASSSRQLAPPTSPDRSNDGGGGKIALPCTLPDAVRAEMTRFFRPPFDRLTTVVVNGALMSSAWFFLPTKLKDDTFTLHGTLAFALVLAAWMYSDVPATNVLAPDRDRVIAAIADPAELHRLLHAKNIVLWMVITPVCAIVAVVNGILNHNLLSTFYTVVAIAIIPFGVLAVSAWVGILFPYHPMPLRFRWQHRRPRWRMLGRWGTLVVAPYVLVPALAALMVAPTLAIWGFTSRHGLSKQLPDRDLGWGVLVACLVALGCSLAGGGIAVRLILRRQSKLKTILADPARG